MSAYYANGCFNSETDSRQTLVRTTDTRTVTLLADLLTVFKQHTRISWADDDALCEMYLNAAMSRIEQWTVMPILPAAYAWDASAANIVSEKVYLPLRNCALAGEQFGFELLIAPKRIATPTTWPVLLEVGFATGAEMPDDIKLSIFQLAASLYELRSNAEMQGIYAQEIMAGNLARYWVARC